jgi:hypothetical protein
MVYPVPKLTFGISAGLLLFEQNAIMADFFHSSGTEYYNSSTVISEASCLSARFKRYFGNSINMEAGVTAKSINVIHRDNGDDGDEADTETETDSSTSTSESIDIKQNILTLGPQLTFGNQWQFSHFTIGGNWVEVFLPISVSQTTTGEDSLTERQRKRVYERGTQRADDIEFSARMFIGASF